MAIETKNANNRSIQYLAMLSGSLTLVSSGINVGWSSPYLPLLLDPNSKIRATTEEAAWCAIMPPISAPIGSFSVSYIVDRIGPKKCILSLTPIIISSLIAMAFAESILTLCICRFIIGITEGAMYVTVPMYFGEMADSEIRGLVSSSISVACQIGMILINVIGPMLSIRNSSFVCIAIPVLHFCTFIWMPESPYYYLRRGDRESAKKSLRRFRGKNDVDAELREINVAIKRQEAVEKSNFINLIRTKSNRKAMFIHFILCFTNKFSGKAPMIFYTTIIFANAGGSISPVLSAIIVSIVALAATILGLFTIDWFGRRPLILFSSIGCALALGTQGAYFTLQLFYPELIINLGWLPITAIIVYSVVFSLGLAMGPTLVLSEIFPVSVKAKAFCVADTTSALMATISSKFFQMSTDSFGMHVPFWTFSACALLGTVLIYRFVPETKGRSLEEIQFMLMGKEVETKNEKKLPTIA